LMFSSVCLRRFSKHLLSVHVHLSNPTTICCYFFTFLFALSRLSFLSYKLKLSLVCGSAPKPICSFAVVLLLAYIVFLRCNHSNHSNPILHYSSLYFIS
jgi:hypothetical protein